MKPFFNQGPPTQNNSTNGFGQAFGASSSVQQPPLFGFRGQLNNNSQLSSSNSRSSNPFVSQAPQIPTHPRELRQNTVDPFPLEIDFTFSCTLPKSFNNGGGFGTSNQSVSQAFGLFNMGMGVLDKCRSQTGTVFGQSSNPSPPNKYKLDFNHSFTEDFDGNSRLIKQTLKMKKVNLNLQSSQHISKQTLNNLKQSLSKQNLHSQNLTSNQPQDFKPTLQIRNTNESKAIQQKNVMPEHPRVQEKQFSLPIKGDQIKGLFQITLPQSPNQRNDKEDQNHKHKPLLDPETKSKRFPPQQGISKESQAQEPPKASVNSQQKNISGSDAAGNPMGKNQAQGLKTSNLFANPHLTSSLPYEGGLFGSKSSNNHPGGLFLNDRPSSRPFTNNNQGNGYTGLFAHATNNFNNGNTNNTTTGPFLNKTVGMFFNSNTGHASNNQSNNLFGEGQNTFEVNLNQVGQQKFLQKSRNHKLDSKHRIKCIQTEDNLCLTEVRALNYKKRYNLSQNSFTHKGNISVNPDGSLSQSTLQVKKTTEGSEDTVPPRNQQSGLTSKRQNKNLFSHLFSINSASNKNENAIEERNIFSSYTPLFGNTSNSAGQYDALGNRISSPFKNDLFSVSNSNSPKLNSLFGTFSNHQDDQKQKSKNKQQLRIQPSQNSGPGDSAISRSDEQRQKQAQGGNKNQ